MKNNRYHYQIMILKNHISVLSIKIQKFDFFKKHNFAVEFFVFRNIISALNTVLNYSFDSAHNEYFEIVRKFFFIIDTLMLINRTFLKFNDIFQ